MLARMPHRCIKRIFFLLLLRLETAAVVGAFVALASPKAYNENRAVGPRELKRRPRPFGPLSIPVILFSDYAMSPNEQGFT